MPADGLGFLAAIFVVTAGPATPNAFALLCSGEKVEQIGGHRTRTAWEQILQLDLKQKTWCEADCKTHHPIVAVKDDYIDLISENESGFTTQSHLNRNTGGYTFLSKGKRAGHAVEVGVLAYCERATRID